MRDIKIFPKNEKEKKQEYGRERYIYFPENKKENKKLVEYRK